MKCTKRRYANELEAKIVLSRITRPVRRNSTREEYVEKRVYYCKYCSGYHLTSEPLRIAETCLCGHSKPDHTGYCNWNWCGCQHYRLDSTTAVR